MNLGTATTITLTAGQGSAGGGLVAYKAEGSVTLAATDGALSTASTGGAGVGLTVSAATADHFAFTTQPSGAVYKTAFTTQPVVKTTDPFGNLSTVGLGSSVSVTLSLTTGTGPLAGTTSLDIGTAHGNGTVTYSGLQINKAENGDVLTANASGFTGKASSAFNVSKATLTVAATGIEKIYDGTTAATVTLSDNRFSGDVLTDSYTTATFADRNVANGTAVSVSGLAITGTDSSNYQLSSTTASTSANITRKALTVTGITAASTIYDGTTTAKLSGTAAFATAEMAGSGTTSDGIPYSVDSVSAGGTVAGTLASRNVGSQAVTITGVTVTGTGNGNYTATQQTGLTQTVTAKELTVTGITAASTIYDGTTTAKLSGTAAFATAETAGSGTTSDGIPYSVDSVSAGGTAAGTLASRNVGSQAVTITGVTVTGNGNGNYTATQQTGLTQTVTAKELTVSGITASSTIYDGTTTAKLGGTAAFQAAEAAGAGTTSDGKPYTGNGDSVSIGGTAAGTLAAKDVGTQNVTITGNTVTGTGNGNYTVTQQTGLTQAVTTKALNYAGISAANKIYDATTTVALSGTAATLTAEAPGAGSTSDGAPYTGDTVSFTTATLTGTFDSKDVANGIAVTLTSDVTLAAGGQSANYSVGSPSTAITANITPKALTMSGLSVPASKVYDGTTSASVSGTPALESAETVGSGDTSDGKPYTDDVVSISGTATGTYNSPDVATASTVTFGGLSLGGDQAGDYTLTMQSAAAATITPASTLSAVTATSNPALPGANVTFTNTLSVVSPGAGTPTGTVQFRTNEVAFGDPVALGGGAAFSLTTASLPHGSNTVTAEYAGDGNFLGSTNSLSEVINTPPATGPFALGTTNNAPVTFAVSKLLKVCTDADQDTLSVLDVDATSTNGGTVSVVGTNLTYAPASNYVGADSFSYRVTDAYYGGTATGTVSVTVRLGNFSGTIGNSNIEQQPDLNMRIIASGIPGGTYLIQATTNVSLSPWETIATNVALANGLISFVDLTATNYTSRYYRISTP